MQIWEIKSWWSKTLIVEQSEKQGHHTDYVELHQKKLLEFIDENLLIVRLGKGTQLLMDVITLDEFVIWATILSMGVHQTDWYFVVIACWGVILRIGAQQSFIICCLYIEVLSWQSPTNIVVIVSLVVEVLS